MVEADLERAEERAEQGEKYVEKKNKTLLSSYDFSSNVVMLAICLIRKIRRSETMRDSCKFVFCSD